MRQQAIFPRCPVIFLKIENITGNHPDGFVVFKISIYYFCMENDVTISVPFLHALTMPGEQHGSFLQKKRDELSFLERVPCTMPEKGGRGLYSVALLCGAVLQDAAIYTLRPLLIGKPLKSE